MSDNVDELKQQLERKIARSGNADLCGSRGEGASNIAEDA
jgi:hypothetical protein